MREKFKMKCDFCGRNIPIDSQMYMLCYGYRADDGYFQIESECEQYHQNCAPPAPNELKKLFNKKEKAK